MILIELSEIPLWGIANPEAIQQHRSGFCRWEIKLKDRIPYLVKIC
jgi:hypothetical protein